MVLNTFRSQNFPISIISVLISNWRLKCVEYLVADEQLKIENSTTDKDWCHMTIEEKFTQTNATPQGVPFRQFALISIGKFQSRNFISLKWWAPCEMGFWFSAVIPYNNFIYLIDNTRTARERGMPQLMQSYAHTHAQPHHSFRFVSFFFRSWIGSFAKAIVWYCFCYLLFTFRIYYTEIQSIELRCK